MIALGLIGACSSSTPTVLAAAPTMPGGLAVDGASVYWTDTPGGFVYKTSK